jgi:hypothetical protein
MGTLRGFFQVEIFQYRKPRSRPRRLDWSPADWGYSMVSVHVRDFDDALDRLAALGSLPYTEPLGPIGDRRVCVPDPDRNLVELLERDPLAHVAPPWPDGYRLSDLGYMNVAVGFRDTGEFDRWFANAQTAGWTPHGKPLEVGIFKVMYVDDVDGFDVEMLRSRTWADRLTGFAPSMPYAVAEQHVDARPQAVWEQISDLAGMEAWSGLPVQIDATTPAGLGPTAG